VPITPDDPASEANRRAWAVLMNWDKPFLTTFSDKDPILGGGEKVFKKFVPGAAGQPHVIIEDGGHFLQEDKGEEIAAVIIEFIARDT
jgi:haloalkane dehalogenase